MRCTHRPPALIEHEQICAKCTQHKRRKQEQIIGDDQRRAELQRRAEQSIQRGQRVKRQVDLNRMEHPIDVEDVKVGLRHQPFFDPPEVPRQRRVIDAVARGVGGEMGGQGPGEKKGQQAVKA